MSAEETALRFLRAAVAAQLHKNASFAPLLWNLAIVSMRISTGAPRRSRGRCKVFGQFRPKTLHLSKAGNLESQGFQGFRLCSVRIKIRYFHGNRRALRVGAFPKNPTRRWRYQNKTIVLFFMDSSMIRKRKRAGAAMLPRVFRKASPAGGAYGVPGYLGRRTMSGVMSARECAPHMVMVSVSPARSVST